MYAWYETTSPFYTILSSQHVYVLKLGWCFTGISWSFVAIEMEYCQRFWFEYFIHWVNMRLVGHIREPWLKFAHLKKMLVRMPTLVKILKILSIMQSFITNIMLILNLLLILQKAIPVGSSSPTLDDGRQVYWFKDSN